MTSSGYNLNPFPYFPPPSTASYNLPLSLPSLLNCDPSANNTPTFNFHQPHQDPVSFLAPYFPIGHFSTSMMPEAVINFAVSGNNIHALGNIPSAPRMGTGTGKKDRHSKIYTAQGLRDRRVRLSIDIARKFFDLQDMLGYDKASKTLEWLLGKSKKAIKELSKTKCGNFGVHGGAKRMSLASDFEEEEEEEKEKEKEEGGWGLKMKSMLSLDEEVKVSNKIEVFNLLAKESRDKARARARERTMEKKQVGDNSGDHDTKIYGHQKRGDDEVSDHWSKHLDQSTETPNLSIGESSFMDKRKIYAKKFIDEDGVKPCREDDAEISQWKLLDQMKASKGHLQEPSMIKRKWRPSIISGSSERNLLISVDGIPINLTQNWESNSNPNYPFPK